MTDHMCTCTYKHLYRHMYTRAHKYIYGCTEHDAHINIDLLRPCAMLSVQRNSNPWLLIRARRKIKERKIEVEGFQRLS